MPRKVTKSLVRPIEPDRQYNSVQVQRVINRVMLDGKKQLSEKLVYHGMQKAADKLKVQNPLDVFDQAMNNIKPHMETRSRRVGGANYQIPFEVKGQRQNHLTTMWFVQAARARKGMSMEDRIALELIDAYNNTGTAVKKKEEFLAMIQEGGKCPGLIVLETPISRIASVRHEMCGIEFVEAETELLEREAEAITKYAGE